MKAPLQDVTEIYVVIGPNEDGETALIYTREEFEGYLSEQLGYEKPVEFLSSWPSGGIQYWGERQILVVKGRIVVPRVAEKITRYEVE